MSSQTESVIIVGGGIIGIACAHYLSRAGLQVTVIDRGKMAAACSHANCGYISPSHVLPLTEPAAIQLGLKSLFNPNAPFRIKPQLSPALWNWMFQFARRCNHRQMIEAGRQLKAILDSSMTEYQKIIADEKIECQWKETGLLYVFETDAGIDKFRKTNAFLTENFGVSARELNGKEMVTFEPALKENLAGAYFYDCDASLRPDELAAQWIDRLRQRGVIFMEDCELNSVHQTDGRTTHISTSRGDLKAEQFVFAMGAWSPKIAKQLGCRIPIQPGKGYSVTMARPDPCPIYPMLFPEHKVGVSPFANGYRLGSMMEFAGYDTTIPARRIEQLRRSAEPYLKQPHTTEILETWYGWRPMTWDSLPIIGRLPKLQNTFLASGHNMLGLSLAPATGKMIVELMHCQTPHLDPTAFSPLRFGV